MNKFRSKLNECKDCNGKGYIITPLNNYANCIICNASGTTTHEPMKSEAEQTLLYKIAMDFINGKTKGWYH